MTKDLMLQEYNRGPKQLANRPNYKLWTYEESQVVQARHNWILLAVVLALIGGFSGYMLRCVYDYNLHSTAIAAQWDWVAEVDSREMFTVLMTVVGAVLGVMIAYLFRNKYAQSDHCWTWFSSAAVLPMGTFLAAPVVVWLIAVVVGLVTIAIGLAVIYFIWNMIFG